MSLGTKPKTKSVSLAFDPTTETGDGHLNHTVVPPLQDRPSKAAGDPHCRLQHLDGPRHFSPRPRIFAAQPKECVTDEVPGDPRADEERAIAVDQLNLEAHAVREGRGDNATKDRPCRQAVALDLELAEPGPPSLELVDLFKPFPELIRCQVEPVLAPIGDEWRCHFCQVMWTQRALARDKPCEAPVPPTR
jgi:hypothetical protein